MATDPFEKRRIVVQFNKHSLISLNTPFAERAARSASLAGEPTVAALYLQRGAEKLTGLTARSRRTRSHAPAA